MGYIMHDAIVVTGFLRDEVHRARTEAMDRGLLVSEPVQGTMNGYETFLIAPDGSKEGWKDSNSFDEKRNAWLQWLTTSGLHLTVVHVRFGDSPSYVVEDDQ
jgi:hypothetical protein